MKIKVLISLCLMTLLCQLSPIAKSQTEERLKFVVPAAPWVLSLAKGNLVIDRQQIKPDGSAGYFLLNDHEKGLAVSLFIEPATKCNDSKSCRDMVLKLGNPGWEKPENVIKSEIEGVSYFEFFMPSFRGVPIKQQHMYVEFVMDGFWVDLHISKSLYTSRDHQVFEQLVKSVKFEPKKVRSAQGLSAKVATRSYKVSTVGSVEMSVPVQWQENVRLLDVPPAFTLAYRLPASKDFYMKVTSAWEPQQERASRDPGWLRRAVESTGGALDKKNLKLIEVTSPSAKGYYFQLAHNERLPIGEFKFLVQGIVDLGTITLVFSAYSREKDMPELGEALRVVQSAHFIAAN